MVHKTHDHHYFHDALGFEMDERNPGSGSPEEFGIIGAQLHGINIEVHICKKLIIYQRQVIQLLKVKQCNI